MATTKEWRNWIEQAIRYKEKYSNSQRWPIYKDYYRGRYSSYKGTNEGILPYNLTYAMARTIVPATYFRNPYVMVSNRMRPGQEIQSKVIESLMNWSMEVMEVKAAFKTSVLDAVLCGRGIIKLGFDSEYGFRRGQADTRRGKNGAFIEYDSRVREGMPWLKRQDPSSYLVPFGVRELDDCPWVDHIILRPTEDVRNDKKYKGVKDFKGSLVEKSVQIVGKQQLLEDLKSVVDITEIHEIRDVRTGEVLCLILGGSSDSGGDQIILGPIKDDLQLGGLPLVSFCFNEDPEHFWCAGDAEMLEPCQLEMNEVKTQAMYHRRVALLKFLAQKGAIDPAERDKFLSENVAPFIEVNGDPTRLLSILQPHIPPDFALYGNGIREDVREIIGMSRQGMGELPSGRRTKFEVSVAQQGQEIRMDEKRDAVADALEKAMRKTLQIMLTYWKAEHVTQVVGYDGARYWVQLDPKEILDEYNFKVDVESMGANSKAQKRQDIMQIIQALGSNPRANLDYLLKALLQEFEWVDALKVLPEAPEAAKGPMPMQQYQQQQQGLLNNPEMLKQRVMQNAGRMMLPPPGTTI